MKEAGLDYEVPFWTAIYAPAATPKPLIAQLEVALRTAMRDPLVVKQLADLGTEAVGSTSDELDTLTRQQFALYRGIVQENRSLLGEP